MRYLKIPNDKNKKSCDQNDETFWSHDLTKIEIAFEISCGDVDSLVIFVIIILRIYKGETSLSTIKSVQIFKTFRWTSTRKTKLLKLPWRQIF